MPDHTSQLRLILALLLTVVLAPLGSARPAWAQSERCFNATGYCIAGEVRQLWEQGGGLPVFGYPLTPLQEEQIEGRTVKVQWFERHRLELHPEQPRAFRVQLGRLGVEILARQGRSDQLRQGGEARPGCRFFPQTGRNLCGAMLAHWRAGGIELDGARGKSEAESLALFGLPLTELQEETLADGRNYLVQWFERARLEIHPELAGGTQVLSGLLGAELGPRPSAPSEVSLVRPVRISIPKIGVDAAITVSGVDAQGVPIVPRHDVGWYSQSAAPGEGENIVLWGHVLRWSDAPAIPAPFAKVKNLRPGDMIVLSTRGGESYSYVVSRQTWVKPDEVQHILPQGREQLTLVSCIGDQVIEDGEVIDMSHRLITVALPVK